MSFPTYIDPATGERWRREGQYLVCGDRRVPIEDGIPRFAEDGYTAAFGLQWNRFEHTQLDSRTGVPLSRDRLRDSLGGLDGLDGCLVLEIGAGAGRFTEILLDEGAIVDSVDMSSAVDANARNCPIGPNHRVTQADLRALPMPEAHYDLVLCLGVVQHTPDTFATIDNLLRYVRPGGRLVFDHYRLNLVAGHLPRLGMWRQRRRILKLSPEEQMRATDALVKRWLPLHRFLGRRTKLQKALYLFSPINAYYHRFPLDPDQQREWALLDTHDGLTDTYKRLVTQRQLRSFLATKGLRRCSVRPGGTGIVCVCEV